MAGSEYTSPLPARDESPSRVDSADDNITNLVSMLKLPDLTVTSSQGGWNHLLPMAMATSVVSGALVFNEVDIYITNRVGV